MMGSPSRGCMQLRPEAESDKEKQCFSALIFVSHVYVQDMEERRGALTRKKPEVRRSRVLSTWWGTCERRGVCGAGGD